MEGCLKNNRGRQKNVKNERMTRPGGEERERRAAAFALTMAACLTAGIEPGAAKNDEHFRFEISEETLGPALKQLAEQSQKQLFFPFEIAATPGARPLSGRYTVDEALKIILQDLGFYGGLTEGDVITIYRLSDSQLESREELEVVEIKSKKGLAALLSSVSAVVLGGVTGANAQDEAPGDEIVVYGKAAEYFRATSSNSATGFDISLQDLPQSVSVITDDFLRTTITTRLEDVLDYVAGAGFGDRQGFGGFEQDFVLRGRRVDDLRNVRLNGYAFSNFGIIDTAGFERIEFPKGPSSIVYGFGSYGGIINLVTKKPQAEFAGEVDIQYASFDTFRVVGDITGPIDDAGKMRFRLITSYEDRETFRTGSNVSPRTIGVFSNDDFVNEGEERRSISIFPSFEYDISENTLFSVFATYQDTTGTADAGITFYSEDPDNSGFWEEGEPFDFPTTGQIPRNAYLGEPGNNDTGLFTRSIVARVQHEASDNTTVGASVSWSNVKNTQRSVYLFPYYPITDTYTSAYSYAALDDDDDTNFVAEINVLHNFEAFGREHQVYVMGGYDVLDTEFSSSGNGGPLVDIVSPDWEAIRGELDFPTTAQFNNDDVAFGTVENFSYSSWNIGAQLLLEVTDWFTLLGGARYDRFKREATDYSPEFGLSTPSNVFNDTSNELSYRVSGTFKLSDEINAYAHYSAGFEPRIGRIRGGGAVNNETGRLVEVGVKGELLDGSLGVSVAAYQLNVDDQSLEDPTNGLGENFFVTTGETRYQGVEFEAIGQLTSSLSISASFAHVDSEIREDVNPDFIGRDVVIGPNTSGALVVNYAFDIGNKYLDPLGIGAAVRYTGKRRQAPLEDFLAIDFESYTLVDVFASYALTDTLEVMGTVDNIFDEEYFLVGPQSFPSIIFWGEPRTYRVGIRKSF